MNQHSPNTKASKVREALCRLGRATSTRVAWESGVNTKYAQSVLSRMAGWQQARRVGIALHHDAGRGNFPYIYEAI